MNIIIDKRMRMQEKQYLKRFGEFIELPPQNSVYDEISGHPDIFFTKINDQIFKAKNVLLNHKAIMTLEEGEEEVGHDYPEDVKYNICQIGNNIIHDFKYTDKRLLKHITNQKNLKQIPVHQGYSKCNIAVTSNNSCITSDEGIYNFLKLYQLDVLLLKDENIHLLDRNGNMSKMNGFIGGAAAILYDKFILFGDSDKLKNLDQLLEHLHKYNLNLIDFKGLDIIDYGGIITF